MADISLCMIIRDEEARIPEFLAHAQGAYDQLVVVDTGSTDRSRELFVAAGAEVHDFPWIDDFAAARNESLRFARGEWILILDADEFPHPGFAAELRALAARPDVAAATILKATEQRNGIDRQARELRLFRRDPAIRYRHRIHEDASASVRDMLARTGRVMRPLMTPVRHTGYTAPVAGPKNKRARDERILKLAIAESPDDLYSRYKLLELYRFHGQATEMAPIAAECLAILDQGAAIEPPHIAGDLVTMIAAVMDAKAGLSFLTAMAPRAAHTGHYHLDLATRLEGLGDLGAAGRHFRIALRLAPGEAARALLSVRALMGLARVALVKGDRTGASTIVDAALELAPADPEAMLLAQYLRTPERAAC